MPNNIIMADTPSGGSEVAGTTFKVARKIVHIESNNGVANTQAAQNYVWNLCGNRNTSLNQLVYFRYVDEPTPVENLIRNIGPNNNVSRYKNGSWQSTSVGSAYDGKLAEGDVECCWFELT